MTNLQDIVDSVYNYELPRDFGGSEEVIEVGGQDVLVPKPCLSCKLLCRYKEGQNKSHNIQPRVDAREKPEAKGTILIVTKGPSFYEDRDDTPMTSHEGGTLLHAFVHNLKNRYVIANAYGCHAGTDGKGKEVALKESDTQGCTSFYLDNLIRELKPKVVVFLGAPAMKAVLKQHSPKTLNKAIGDPIKLPELDYFVLGTYDPKMHTTGKRDLINEYARVFTLADKLCSGDFHVEVPSFELVTETSRCKELARSMSEKICLDTEDDHDLKKNIIGGTKPTIYHPGVKMILMQITEKAQEGLKTYVFVSEVLTKENIIGLINNRVLVMHNFKYDRQSLRQVKKINIFKHIKGFERGYEGFGFEDTFLKFVCMDQGRIGNSLKKRSELHFNINAYDTELWMEIDKVNKAISDSHALLKSLISSHEKILKSVQKSLDKAKELELNPPKRKAAKKAEPVIDVLTVMQQLEDYKAQQARLRPLNAANFGDVNKDTLYQYGACDTHFDYKLEEEVLSECEKQGLIHPTALELNYRNVYTFSYVEEWGLPINMKRHTTLNGVIDEKVRNIKEWLIGNAYVQVALSRTKEVIKLAEKGKLTYDYLLDEAIKPNKKGFLAQLLLVTDVVTVDSIRTKMGDYKLDESVLEDISGGEDDTKEEHRLASWNPSAKKNEIQWVWYLILRYRKLLDIQRKFLAQLGQFAVNDRLHPDFVLARVEMGTGAKGTITGRVATTNPNLLNIKKDPALRWIFEAILNEDILDPFSRQRVIQLVNVVHDSLLLIVDAEFLDIAIPKIHEVLGDMSTLPFKFDVPLRHTLKIGEDMSRLDDYDTWVSRGKPVSRTGAVFVECDFSSQEPVVMTVVTGCKAWKYIFENNLDLYACIANDIYGGVKRIDKETGKDITKPKIDIYGPIDEVRKRLSDKKTGLYPKGEPVREDTKTSTLAIMYGQSAWEFSKRTGIPKDQVEYFYKHFDLRFPEIKAYKDRVRADVKAGKMMETLFGCRRGVFLQKTGDWKQDARLFNRTCLQLANFLIQQPGFGITAWLSHLLVRWICE